MAFKFIGNVSQVVADTTNQRRQKIRDEQIRILFGQLSSGAFGAMFGAIALSLAMYGQLPTVVLISWSALVILFFFGDDAFLIELLP